MEEKFEISGGLKKKISMTAVIGAILLAIGIIGLSMGKFDPASSHGHGHDAHGQIDATELKADHHEEGAHAEEADHGHAEASEDHGDHGHHAYHWSKRIKADLWHNAVFFLGISLIGLFFLCIQYITWAGWSAAVLRVMQSMGYYLYPGGILIIVLWFVVGHDVFHWTDHSLFDPESANYDKIIAGKAWYLNTGFYISRLVLIPIIWMVFHYFMTKMAASEDLEGGTLWHNKMINTSAGFVVFFGVSSSVVAWDWVMSIDTHWFSTLFGWYVFVSWLVPGMCVMALIVIYLKEMGLLKIVNDNHLHDIGKFMFAFSIFWTYLWFSQFLLYWYSNIPEETVYFIERLFFNDGVYTPVFVINLIINFVFPFLFMMTRDAKRTATLVKIAAWGLIVGHWLDFYLMIMPGSIGNHGGLNLGTIFVELGMTLLFASLFIGSIAYGLTKMAVVPKNHPMLEESKHFHQ